MAQVTKEVLTYMVGQVDWNMVMYDLVEKDPDAVAEILNRHFGTQTEKTVQEKALNEVYSLVVDAWNSRDQHGRMTNNCKLSAIKKLRQSFGVGLGDAKVAVEKMMENYDRDPSYYPTYTLGVYGNYVVG